MKIIKTVKQGIIRTGLLKGERYKIKQLSDSDMKKHCITAEFIICQGEYDDIDFEADSLKEAVDFVSSW
ncbi:hypothetical protein [Sedimentibacter sp.]|uniref:hypothetical protein n=1 Tax=Sedimentibacter sp. TaxID=1960295 RepID=UPI0028B1B1A1|nr:hypothetical protein [Sedimentibacter sp.]